MAEYIERQTVIDEVREAVRRNSGDKFGGVLLHYTGVVAMLEGADAANVAPVRRGRWMVDGCDAICSNCRDIFCGDWDDLDLIADCDMHYCPNCGAKMEEEP